MKVFAIGRGQYENIGDIVLRRQLLDWVRPDEGLHVYLGEAPAGYERGLRLGPADVVYRSLKTWYIAAMRAALAGDASYVFKPGEIQLTLVGMKEHLSMLPLLLAIRARGGRVVRAGAGGRSFAPLPRALMAPSVSMSDLTLWRDERTAHYMGAGGVMPDLAFGEGADEAAIAAFRAGADRRVLVVSMRSDEDVHPCPYPTDAWFEGVRAYADRHGLEIWAVTQVQVDDERTRRIATDLGGRALTWDAHIGHDEQEARLRALYRRTAIALSDRLHVIIAAYTEGAVPVGSMVEGTDKIDRHFRTIGVEGIALRTGGTSAEDLVTALERIAGRRPELMDRLLDARKALGRCRALVRGTLAVGGTPAVPATADGFAS